MGLCSRRFPSHAKMSAVYDWVGSLSADPPHFELRDPSGVIVLANSELSDRCTMSMVKSSHIPAMSDSDDEVHFQGFGDMVNCSTDAVPHLDANA